MLKNFIRIYPAVQRSQRKAGGVRKNLEDIFCNKRNKKVVYHSFRYHNIIYNSEEQKKNRTKKIRQKYI